MLKSIISRLPSIVNVTTSSKLSSLCKPKLSHPYQQSTSGMNMPVQESNSLLLKKCLLVCRNMDSVRTNVRIYYRYNAYQRIRKYGLDKRLSSRSQREILCQRFVKGKWTLSPFDRFTNKFPEQKTPGQKRVQLMDRKVGYRSKVKKPEYFEFNN